MEQTTPTALDESTARRRAAPALRAPVAAVWLRVGARVGLRWLGATGLAMVLALLLLVVLVHPSPADLRELAGYLLFSSVISVAFGEAALWLADVARIGSVRLKLAIPTVLTTVLIAFNVVLISRMMFISSKDGQLLLVFLAFGISSALLLSFSIAARMVRAIMSIETGARRLADGDYGYRLPEHQLGAVTELAQLARWFNSMATSVEDAFARQHAAESERRQVVAAVSHDLRTPLASVRAMIEAIDDGIVTDAEMVRRYQRTIRAEVRHMSALMNDLFELSQLESGAFALQREPMALDDILSDALEAMHEPAEHTQVHLAGKIDGALPMLSLDARQMHRVLTNLLHNALQHTPPGGVVLLHARAEPDATVAQRVCIQVVDSGEGIAPTDLPHIFERTYRGETSRQRQGGDGSGAGLGLAIARGIVEAHGGAITASSPVSGAQRTLLSQAVTSTIAATIDPPPAGASLPALPGSALTVTLPVSG